VTAVAIAATVIATGTGGHLSGGAPSAVSPPAGALVRGVPPYYVLIADVTAITVRDTRTGAVLATVHPPRGDSFFTAAAGPDDDSFLLATSPSPRPPSYSVSPSRLYLLRFNPATHDTTLVRLPIPAVPDVVGLTIAPGGTELAVASLGPNGSQLRIFSLSGRLIRQWWEPGTICVLRFACLSWAASGYLAFLWTNNGTKGAKEGISVIPATAASGSLLNRSRLVVAFKEFGPHSPLFETQASVLSGDGATIAAAVILPRLSAFEEFSAASGKLTGRFWQSPRTLFTWMVLWGNRTGSTLIVVAPFPGPASALGSRSASSPGAG
jgi:hypothetical protein